MLVCTLINANHISILFALTSVGVEGSSAVLSLISRVVDLLSYLSSACRGLPSLQRLRAYYRELRRVCFVLVSSSVPRVL